MKISTRFLAVILVFTRKVEKYNLTGWSKVEGGVLDTVETENWKSFHQYVLGFLLCMYMAQKLIFRAVARALPEWVFQKFLAMCSMPPAPKNEVEAQPHLWFVGALTRSLEQQLFFLLIYVFVHYIIRLWFTRRWWKILHRLINL